MTEEALLKELTKDVNTLSIIDEKLENVPQEVQDAKITSPVSSVENSLSKFFNDAINASINDFKFNCKIQDEIESRLHSFNNAELITLLTNNKTSDNDRTSKILGPSFQLMTAKQQAEIAAITQASKNNETTMNNSTAAAKELNASVSKDVLKGMQQLYNMIMLASNKENATDIQAVVKPDTNSTNE